MSKTNKKPSKKESDLLYIKASRRGSRDAELESENGFTSKHKIHKSKKSYSRKPKHREF